MIETLLMIAVILYAALQIEDRLGIPSPLGLIAGSLLAHLALGGAPMITGEPERFAELVLFLLPILLISDSLELELEDLKEHGLSLFYLAVVAVALSVVAAVLIAPWLFPQLSTAAVIALFAMVLATDPVSVVSIFSKFRLPHRLKLLAEGESLFNDATALIVFVFIGLHMLEGGRLTAGYLAEVAFAVGLGSIALGVAVGLVGLALLKTTENRIAEMMVLIATGYGAFALAEHFYVILELLGAHTHLHLSGILAVITATITVNHVMTRAVQQDEARIAAEEREVAEAARRYHLSAGWLTGALARIRATVEERDRHLRTRQDVQLLALVANTVLFVAMAEIVDFGLLARYAKEILVMFAATTVIRALMMAKFAWITNRTTRMVDVNPRWWAVLTLAGVKGGLSIVMVSMIPRDFPWREMFEAVVIGVVLLSTFVYSLLLLALIARHREAFAREAEEEKSPAAEDPAATAAAPEGA